MNWTELNALLKFEISAMSLQTPNCKLWFAVSHEKPDAKGLYLLLTIGKC